MKTILSGFIALVVLAWGADLAARGAGPGALPWLAREQGLYLSGLLSIALMSFAMVLATRPPWLERPFGGMDRVYRAHKWAGILAGGFAVLHWLVEQSGDLLKALFGRAGRPPKEEFLGLLENLRDAGEELGEFAFYALLAVVLLTLWKRFPYKFWRHLHRVMPALYLMLAFHAAVLAPPGWWSGPAGGLLAILLVAGMWGAGVSLAGRIGHGRRAGGQVVAVGRPAPDVTEVVCRLDGDWRGHRAGQFAFVTFDRGEGAHPFTIASADQSDRRVSFHIKALGDYTRALPQCLAAGQPVSVEGPYGRFELVHLDRRARQIWVAGGIGVTPFLAWLDALNQDGAQAPAAELHYCTRRADGDPFVARLQTLCRDLPGLALHIHDAAAGERLSAVQLAGPSQGAQRAEVWFCGPAAMAAELRHGLSRAWRGRLRFHQEAFEMR
ncbi:ferredoxin reductase family protein [Pseudothauera rhizosphaerae]|uniref:Ferric reductase n=1 Tax=Pseudothauera rhizosphaerae TaxID=2565932 RepID=A0A4S4AY66_9RHOO|nr:ferric reductase-like transmembrane domain-containing protein [Pseudothauera rhizosphaerae]THF65076.1 ferric reductase [Pseudothauera rhizosphaerae]